MSRKFSSAIRVSFCSLCLLGTVVLLHAQTLKPLVYTTAQKLTVAKIKTGNTELTVRGNGTLTVNAANEDDTAAVAFVFTLADDARQKIAQALGKPPSAIPATLTKKNLVARFQRGTACPDIHLEIAAVEADLADAQMQFSRLVFDINEASDEMTQLFCNWTRQINAKRQRRGIISAINRLLVGEPAAESK